MSGAEVMHPTVGGPATITTTYGRELTVGDFIVVMADAWEISVDDVLRLLHEYSRSFAANDGTVEP